MKQLLITNSLIKGDNENDEDINNDDNDEDDDDDDVEIGLHVVEDSTDDAKLQRLSTAEKEEAAQVQPETLIDRQTGDPARLPVQPVGQWGQKK
jgi:hypothetical protein